jgi:hypothetical protein
MIAHFTALLIVLLCTVLPPCARANSFDYTELFSRVSLEWEQTGRAGWRKRFIAGGRSIVLITNFVGDTVLFKMWIECPRRDRIEILEWHEGDTHAFQNDCASTKRTIPIPHDLLLLTEELPREVIDFLNQTQRMRQTRLNSRS